jgi:hypothetical protein
LPDAHDEIGAVGKVEIVDAELDAGPDQSIVVVAIGLERAGRIDDDVGQERADLSLEITVALEGGGDPLGARRQP